MKRIDFEGTIAASTLKARAKCSSVQAAVERLAAMLRRETGALIPSHMIHVPVEEIGRNCKILDIVKSSRIAGDSRIFPIKGGFRVIIKEGVSEGRRRFTLGHEIGHTFFYDTSREVPRRMVPVLQWVERVAEERMCQKFAGALLLPPEAMWSLVNIRNPKTHEDLFKLLEFLARKYKVSLQAVISRLGTIKTGGNPFLFVHLAFRPNIYTHNDVCLRVQDCGRIGAFSDIIWRNRSAVHVGLNEAYRLYNMWDELRSNTNSEKESRGAFQKHLGVVHRVSTSYPTPIAEEVVKMSLRLSSGSWESVSRKLLTSSRLYSWDGNESYVVAVLSRSDKNETSGKVPTFDREHRPDS